MKSIIFLLFGILLVGCTTNGKQTKNTIFKEEATQQISKETKIAILGTFHFDATNDYSSVQLDSVFSYRRQKELDELIGKIKAYKPTKILVEWEPETKTELDEKLKKYLQNNFVLPKNEIYQIGFRLAKEVRINELFPIDYQLDLGDEELMEYLTKTNKVSEFEKLIAEITKIASTESNFLKNHTILDYFIKMNSEENDNFNRNIYLEKLSSLAKEPGNPILEYVANWYKRNIFIMGQIDKQLQKDERILVIIGAGHKPILKDLYSNKSRVEYIEISEYLK